MPERPSIVSVDLLQSPNTARVSQSDSSTPPKHHLVAWIAGLTSSDDRATAEALWDTALNAFDGEFGRRRMIRSTGQFHFGLRLPESFLPMTTWSIFEDDECTLFIEGCFYDRYHGYQVRDGEDAVLAKMVADRLRTVGDNAFAELSGAFSGFSYIRRERSFSTFVDRFSVRTVYRSTNGDRSIAASSLAAFRAVCDLSIDWHAAHQFLTIGFPIGDRTLVREVKQQPSASVVRYRQAANAQSEQMHRYWTGSVRQESSLKKAVESLSLAMEDLVTRVASRVEGPIGLGLTGGHDSRVVLSALVYRKVPFIPIMWKDADFNDHIAEELCRIIGISHRTASVSSSIELEDIVNSTLVYSDGLHAHAWGFSSLAKAGSGNGCGVLLAGFSGDRISGSAIPNLYDLRTVEELAAGVLHSQMENMTMDAADSVLSHPAGMELVNTTSVEWLRSFEEQALSGRSIPDIGIHQALANRNVKRIRHKMVPGLRYAQLVFPYADVRVSDAYFSLADRWLKNQKAHCYAGFYRFPKFGHYQACAYPISLRMEAYFPGLLNTARRVADTGRNSRFFQSRRRNTVVLSDKERSIYEGLFDCIGYEPSVLRRLEQSGEQTGQLWRHLDTLKRAWDYYVFRTPGRIG